MEIKAINRKNQKYVNKAVKALIRYNEANDLRNNAEDSDDIKAFKKFDRICEKSFDAYLEACNYLPKREVSQIEKILY